MIVSNEYVFVFVPRTASTSIESAILNNDSNAISIHPDNPPFQSQTYSEAQKYGKPVFSVIREPTEWLLSMYNSHSALWGDRDLNRYRPRLNASKELTKDDILELWYFLSKWYLHLGCYQQIDWIGDSKVILFEEIHNHFPFELPVLNSSEKKILKLNDEALELASQIWKNDYELYHNLKGQK